MVGRRRAPRDPGHLRIFEPPWQPLLQAHVPQSAKIKIATAMQLGAFVVPRTVATASVAAAIPEDIPSGDECRGDPLTACDVALEIARALPRGRAARRVWLRGHRPGRAHGQPSRPPLRKDGRVTRGHGGRRRAHAIPAPANLRASLATSIPRPLLPSAAPPERVINVRNYQQRARSWVRRHSDPSPHLDPVATSIQNGKARQSTRMRRFELTGSQVLSGHREITCI
jgi:hypothetical protein